MPYGAVPIHMLGEHVHVFPQTIDHGDRSVTIHPAAVETDRGLLLLDVGFPGEVEQVRTNLADHGFEWPDVWAVLITHQDGDHAGALADVVDRSGALVLAHRKCAPYVDGREDPIKSEGDRYEPVAVDIELVDRVTIRTNAGPLHVVFTPGHAPGHVSLSLPDAGLLVAADALTAEEGTLQGPSTQFTLDMTEAAESLESIAARSFDRVLCYHGGLVDATPDDVDAIRDKLRR